MTDDPVLTAIAASTNDALTDRLWRYDTATGDPTADLARTLQIAAAEFTTTSQLLSRTLQRLQHQCGHHLQTLTSHAGLQRPHGLDTQALSLVQLLERHELHREVLLAAYQVWRHYRPTSRDPRVRHLHPAPYDPTSGMLTLTTTSEDTWLVTPDAGAAAAYHITAHAGRIVGEITTTGQGWQPTAFTHPEHRRTRPRRVFPLPAVDDEAAAGRSLLRWWALRDRPGCDGLTPEQLTTAQQAALST
ncbi:MAG: hypothetical protein GEV12_08465 [Micromonosporaceae bacterium]|nr:hypothetical protein [Micromonosporaceae bacterium]